MAVKKIIKQNFFSDESTLNESTSRSSSDLSKKIPAENRLGNKIDKFTISDKTGDVSPSLSNTPKLSVITFLGKNSSRLAKKEHIGQLQGKSKKNIFHLRNSILPVISVNRSDMMYLNGELNFNYENSTYGQESSIVTVKNNQFVPFNDRLSRKFLPSEFLSSNAKIIAYPNLTDGNENFVNYQNLDSIGGTLGGFARNGAVDVFGTITSLTNTNPSDIHVFGIRCNFGIIDHEISQYNGERGSSIVDSKYELMQSSYVFFEDSQDMKLDNKVIIENKISYRSDDGVISNSNYKISPFDDKIINENKYNFMSSGRQRLLLSSSNTSMSEIGNRYKSMGNGFVNNPFYTTTIQNNLGTDSILYRGLLRG